MVKVSCQLRWDLTQAQKKEKWKSIPEGRLFGSAALKAPSSADRGGCVSSLRKWNVCWQRLVIPFPISSGAASCHSDLRERVDIKLMIGQGSLADVPVDWLFPDCNKQSDL